MDALTPERLAEIKIYAVDMRYDIMPSVRAALSELIAAYDALAQERARLEVECQGLAATQCDDPASDEYGNVYCLKVQGLEATTAQERARLEGIVTNLRHDLTTVDPLIRSLEETIKNYKVALDETEAKVERLTDVIAGNENTILALTQQVDRLTKEIRAKDTIIEEVAHERDRLKNEIRNLVG